MWAGASALRIWTSWLDSPNVDVVRVNLDDVLDNHIHKAGGERFCLSK